MRIKLFLNKSVEQNAAMYYEKAKKAKKKIAGAKEAVEKAEAELEKLRKKQAKEEALLEEQEKKKIKKEWYHKFRWFITSEGFLVIGGRDATSNEIVVKKHTETGDLVFHTDMAGSPFFVIKKNSNPGEIGESSISETADATCDFSRAWKLGMGSSSVFYVNPDQLSKTVKAGEYIEKGSFIVKGKSNYVNNKINLAVGVRDKTGEFMGAPLEAVKKHCKKFLIVEQGDNKPSECAKKIRKKLGFDDLDEIIRVLPSGGCRVR